jgi:Pvc16 N-terminal domain
VSNFLAVATVTAGLQRVLDHAVSADVPGASASTDRPETRQSTAGVAGVNIFLYEVVPNAAFRSSDLPTRGGDGHVVQRPQAAIDLHYLLSFYGSDADLEPQRLLGTVVRTLHAQPILSPPIIDAVKTAATANPPKDPFLATTDLADQPELVRFTPLSLSLEEMSKLWSVFFQTQYALSVAYKASVVLIEQDETPVVPLPVLERDIVVQPFELPVIESVVPDSSPTDPISATSTVRIRGRGLQGDVTRVRLAGSDRAPQLVRSDEVTFDLSTVPVADLSAGPQVVQVVQEVQLGTPPVAHAGPVSNAFTFPLSPTVTGTAVAGTAASGSVTVDTDLTIRPDQQVTLSLLDPATGGRVGAFAAPRRTVDATSVQVPISGMTAGDHIVQLTVDAANSLLVRSGGVLTGPKVTLT